MTDTIQLVETEHSPETLTERVRQESGCVLLRSAVHDPRQARYSFVTARPFLTFTAWGTRCEVRTGDDVRVHFGSPWQILDALLARFELLDEADAPFPLGGCFGYWGYELKDALESCLTRRAVNDLELPDCHLGFHDSLVGFDHALGTTHVISTGLGPDGSRSRERADRQRAWWLDHLGTDLRNRSSTESGTGTPPEEPALGRPRPSSSFSCSIGSFRGRGRRTSAEDAVQGSDARNSDSKTFLAKPRITMDRERFLAQVRRAQDYIRAGDIYQANLARRWSLETEASPWDFFKQLQAASPAPFSAFVDCGGFQLVSSSPESFLRLSGRHARTRPIKGTRPRGATPEEDTRLAYELQTSPKEQAELVMITDLLRNDLGRVCEYGSVRVPDLFRLERFSYVQHLVSTIEGMLRPEVTHLAALAACFPGGSITGAPKIRAMQIIDELEPVTRGPYTGALGYLGFNRESQLSIAIRTAICQPGRIHFHTGAGIVADSDPAMEFDETTAKARGLLTALAWSTPHEAPRAPAIVGPVRSATRP